MIHDLLHQTARRLQLWYGTHGVCFEKVKEVTHDDQAPFSIHVGITKEGVIVYNDECYPSALVHETGHVLFGLDDDEEEWLGWEWRTVQCLGLVEDWISHNREEGFNLEGQWLCRFTTVEIRAKMETFATSASEEVRRYYPAFPKDRAASYED